MRTGRGKYGFLSTLLVLVVVSVMAAAARQPRIIVVDGMPSAPGDTPECPHTWSFKREDLVAFLPGSRTNVPEFHDCQKLRDTFDSYGPLAAVFAIDRLEGVQDSSLGVTRGRVLALVHLPQGGTYDALGLSKAWACVIVRVRPPDSDAWIVPVDRGADCSSTTIGDVTGSPSPLDLRVLSAPPLHRQIPPVARWDWDESTRTQYIGVRCGSAWCEIGVHQFLSSASHDPGASTGPDIRAGYAMRGAYDEQRLAEFPGGALTPGRSLGTVVPTPELDGLTRTRPPNGSWVPVARTYIAPSSDEYRKKLNFAVTASVSPTETRASTVSLCVGTDTARCRAIERNTTLDIRRCTAEAGKPDTRWIARVDRPNAPSSYFCVLYRGHPTGFYVPPVVRWRWRADDETIWISCPSGCCEVKAKR